MASNSRPIRKISKLSSMTRPIGPGARLTTVWPVMTEKESTVNPMAIARRPTRNSSLRSSPINSGAIAKILSESCTEFVSLRRRSFCLRQMHNDPEWLIGRKFSRPSDDEFLYIAIEIFFAVRKRIQAMKELGDFLDPNLDRIRGSRRICAPWRLTPAGQDGARTSRTPTAPPRPGLRVLRTGALLPARS